MAYGKFLYIVKSNVKQPSFCSPLKSIISPKEEQIAHLQPPVGSNCNVKFTFVDHFH